MAAQPPKSSITPWECSGGSDNPHEPVINNDYKCQKCDKTYADYSAAQYSQRKKEENSIDKSIQTGQRIILFSVFAAILVLIPPIVYATQKVAEADLAISQRKQTQAELAQVNADLEKAKQDLENAKEILKRVPELEKSLAETQTELESTKTLLQTTQSKLAQTNETLAQTKGKLQTREQQVTEGSKCVKLIGEINNVIWEGAALNPDGVMRIQQTLQSVGFYQGEIDGTFAQMTRKAVNNFQQDCQAKLERQ